MDSPIKRFLIGVVAGIALIVARPSIGQEDYPVLVEKNMEWKLLPSDLTRKIYPLTDPGDLRLKLGTTDDGQQFLKIQPPRLRDLSLGIRPTEEEGSYIASAQSAVYWPRQHLLRMQGDVIVSCTHCDLKGEVFDIHLHHDTVRLENPSQVEIEGTNLPLVSQGVRLSGIGVNRAPDFEWDPVIEKNARTEEADPPEVREESKITFVQEPTPAPAKNYELHVGDRWELSFEGKPIELEDLKKEILRIGKEEPESSIRVEQSAAADPEQVRNVHRTLDESGIRKIKTTIIPSGIAQGELNPEVDPKPVDSNESLPALSEQGGRLLWIHEPGRYLFNGKEYSEPALRQALRAYAREYSDLTLVLASSRSLPQGYLNELVQDLKAYGFKHILVAVEP
ncbi:MAG: hypothetical protein KC931_00475 [Candidatus Omnitrophica bacterium]|nr:hypothetical protein [Candidatus Omnitrophota bacterium]